MEMETYSAHTGASVKPIHEVRGSFYVADTSAYAQQMQAPEQVHRFSSLLRDTAMLLATRKASGFMDYNGSHGVVRMSVRGVVPPRFDDDATLQQYVARCEDATKGKIAPFSQEAITYGAFDGVRSQPVGWRAHAQHTAHGAAALHRAAQDTDKRHTSELILELNPAYTRGFDQMLGNIERLGVHAPVSAEFYSPLGLFASFVPAQAHLYVHQLPVAQRDAAVDRFIETAKSYGFAVERHTPQRVAELEERISQVKTA